jgi:nucleotide-binding universal stress UspA family protein
VLPGTTADHVIDGAPCAVAVAPAGYADRRSRGHARVVGAAIDGGDESERVARIAGEIARGANSKLRVLTVIDPPYTKGPLYAGYLNYRSLRNVRSAASGTLQHAAAAAGPDVDVERQLREGSPSDRLIAESNDLDLLIVGSRGYGPVRRVVLGTVTGAVLRGAACPVLVIPRHTPEQLDRSIASVARAATR